MSERASSPSRDELAQRAEKLLSQLVAFDSVSAYSNLPVIDFIETYLHDLGIASKAIPSPDGKKSNLLARIGPAAEGGIVLSGHTDVVPVEGQAWVTDPFTLTEKDGKLYGRGSCDMKGFIAVCLAMAPEFNALKLAKPVYLAFSYDEEVGCLGAPHLLEHITAHVPKPSFAIIGEPTDMKVVTAHKGVYSYMTTVTGHEWHSSQPQFGVNAVQVACELVSFLAGLNAELAASGLQDARFEPSHSTVHVGVIQGGTARNIIPKECHFHWEIRPLPGDDGEAIFTTFKEKSAQLQEKIRKVYDKASIDTATLSHMSGVQLPDHAQGARELVMHCARTNSEQVVSFGTEAGVFNEHGVPAIVCGPGNIQQAHKPNEFIEKSQMLESVDFMLRLAERLPVAS